VHEDVARLVELYAVLGTTVGAAESIASDNTACKWQTPKPPTQMVTLEYCRPRKSSQAGRSLVNRKPTSAASVTTR
jgi:hypothetical protein